MRGEVCLPSENSGHDFKGIVDFSRNRENFRFSPHKRVIKLLNLPDTLAKDSLLAIKSRSEFLQPIPPIY